MTDFPFTLLTPGEPPTSTTLTSTTLLTTAAPTSESLNPTPGTPLPESGPNPIPLTIGALTLAAGLALLTTRRRRPHPSDLGSGRAVV